jgi:hypothetical protein
MEEEMSIRNQKKRSNRTGHHIQPSLGIGNRSIHVMELMKDYP